MKNRNAEKLKKKNEVTIKSSSRGQLRKGNRPWEGSPGETREPMNKNPIGGRADRASWHNTAKPSGLSLQGKWGGCARESHAPYRGRPILRKLGVGVSRGHSSRGNEPGVGRYPFKRRNRRPHQMMETNSLSVRIEWSHPMKDQTSQRNRPGRPLTSTNPNGGDRNEAGFRQRKRVHWDSALDDPKRSS